MTEYAPKTYRKTATVKAMQWDGTKECTQAILDWSGWGPITVAVGTEEPELIVWTLEGPLHMKVGHWVLQGDVGEFWPNRGDTFARSYEQVSDD